MSFLSRSLLLATVLVAAATPLAAQRPNATARVLDAGDTATSAPVSDVRYTVTFDRALAAQHTVRVAMSFTTTGDAPVVLSLPAWTPGAYEITYFSKFVSNFAATAGGKSLGWEKLDFDTWRVVPAGARSVTVSFDFAAVGLDNAMTWARPDFLLFNGTNLFLYPEGRGFDWGATVTVSTDPGWRVVTGMSRAAGAAGAANAFSAGNYHDLVDMPFFVGAFDLDSVRTADRWVRFASYPRGLVGGTAMKTTLDWLSKVVPPEVAVFGEAPWQNYTVMQLADSSYQGASGLEHQNSHVDLITPFAIGDDFMPSLYAHEIFHSWNVKRLRPADLWPYQYAHEQPTPWLWVSEGITDYYADLAEVRGGVVDSSGFFRLTAGKIQEVNEAAPVSLEDASLSTWVHPVDGTGYLYYPKGSLAGFLLDLRIRDASDNKKSLDDVMRQLYQSAYKQNRGFTGDEFWRAVSAAAGGQSFADFNARYIDGREPFPWATALPLAGLRLVADTVARLGIKTMGTQSGVVVTDVDAGSAGEAAGLRAGDVFVSIGDIQVADQSSLAQFAQRYAKRAGAPLPIKVRRNDQVVSLSGTVRPGPGELRVTADPSASPKAVRIRNGILRGKTDA